MGALYVIDQRGEGQGSTGVRVPWWSFTKTVIAAACLRAVEDGLLSLDEPLRASKHTLRQLLRHEAGLPDYGAWPDYQRAVADGLEPWPASEVVRRGLANVADDGQWRYSNIGYALAGKVLSEATGAALEEALRTLVLSPAGALTASLATTRSDLDGIAGVVAGYHPGWVYHGLIVGDLNDAAQVIHALLAGRVIGSDALKQLRQFTPLPQFRTRLWREPAYGLGVMMPMLENGSRIVGHTGEGPGSTIAVYGLETTNGPMAAAAFSDNAGIEAEQAALDALVAQAHWVRLSPMDDL